MARAQMVLPVGLNGDTPAGRADAVAEPAAPPGPGEGPTSGGVVIAPPEPGPLSGTDEHPGEPAGSLAPVPAWVGWLTTVAVLAVAAAAAVASVDHLATLARMAGAAGWKAWLLPVSVDGLATAAALTLYRCYKTSRDAGVLPWLALVAGLAASVAGNVAAVHPDVVDVDSLKIAVGATPPVSLALSVELALRQVRQEVTV